MRKILMLGCGVCCARYRRALGRTLYNTFIDNFRSGFTHVSYVVAVAIGQAK